MPFDSRKLVVRFWLIQPVGGGGGCCPLWCGSTRGGGGCCAVHFGAVQPGGGGGGVLSPFGPFNQWRGGGGMYVKLTFITRVPFNPEGGGGGPWPPLPPPWGCP